MKTHIFPSSTSYEQNRQQWSRAEWSRSSNIVEAEWKSDEI